MILGIDEAGRGPWAGPLVVGAVVLGGVEIEGLDDSKKLTKKRREALEPEILEKAAACGLGWVSAQELDEIGMSAALRLATRRAVEQIHVPYHEIIIDGTVNFLADTAKGKYVTTLPKADALVPSVSAASIIAKVARDRYMATLDDAYPGYHFAKHAGYGVAAHRAAIEKIGACPEHRLSFAPLAKYREFASPAVSFDERVSRVTKRARFSLHPAGRPAVDRSSDDQEKQSRFGRWSRSSSQEAATDTTRAIGNASETIAAEYLQRYGHEILDRNWRTKWCEIDIISRKGEVIYFTEVKHRKNDKTGDGIAAITQTKLRQMKFAAELYAQQYRQPHDLRLSVIATTGELPEVVEYLESL